MFISKKDLKSFHEDIMRLIVEGRTSSSRLFRLKADVKELKGFYKGIPELVTCAKCGCAVIKKDAVKGDGVVKQERLEPLEEVLNIYNGCFAKDYIHYDYFCKRCDKKVKR